MIIRWHLFVAYITRSLVAFNHRNLGDGRLRSSQKGDINNLGLNRVRYLVAKGPLETKQTRLVTFTLDHQRYAVNLSAVERIVPAAEVTPLPRAPGTVLGVIDVQGQILPVFDIRSRFGLPERDMDLNDKLIIANTPRRTVVLVVDSVTGGPT